MFFDFNVLYRYANLHRAVVDFQHARQFGLLRPLSLATFFSQNRLSYLLEIKHSKVWKA